MEQSFEYFDEDTADVGPTAKLDKNLLANMRAWLQRRLNEVKSEFEEGEEQFWGFVLSQSAELAPVRIRVEDDPELSLR